MDANKKLELEEQVAELESKKARHTELITVYVPKGYNINSISKQLEQEKSTASNIKSTGTRKNVIEALESLIRQLKLIKKTPENGLALFAGNVAEKEGQQDMRIWMIEPPEELNVRLYRCDQEFILEPLKEMLEVKEIYGLVVLDRREATLGLLEGKKIKVLQRLTSGVPGKTEKGGQCLSPDSLIMKEDGEIIEIRDSRNPQKLITVDFNNYKITSSSILDKWENEKQLLKIRTKNPCFEIEASEDHLFFLKNGEEKIARNLKVGDYLLFPEKIEVKGEEQKLDVIRKYMPNKEGRRFLKNIREKKSLQKQLAKKLGVSQTLISKFESNERNMDKETIRKACEFLCVDYKEFMSKYGVLVNVIDKEILSEEIARIMGYFLGDGNYDKNRVCFSEANKQTADFYVDLIHRTFGLEPTVRFREKKNYYEIKVCSKELVEFMKLNFPELRKARDSEIPKKVLMSKNSVLSAFLSGLFDAEGYVSDRIGLGVNNKKLIKQLQLCLLRFGIISSFGVYDNKGNPYSDNYRYILEIFDKKSMNLFLEEIGFIKSFKIKELIKKKSITDYTRQILVDGEEIKKLLFDYGEINAGERFGVSSFLNNKRMMSKEIFKKNILDNVQECELKEKLMKIMKREIIPVKIKSITPMGKKQTVDISVKNQNFIANGLIVHNSAARYARIRAGMAKEFFRRIAETMKELYFDLPRLKGIILGGPIPSKEDFMKEGQLVTKLKNLVIGLKDIGNTDESGLTDLVEASQDLLAEQEIIHEKKLLEKFLESLGKGRKAVYKREEVEKALNVGAVETLILNKKLEKRTIRELVEKANRISANIEIVSEETGEGEQFKNLGGIGALLRFEI